MSALLSELRLAHPHARSTWPTCLGAMPLRSRLQGSGFTVRSMCTGTFMIQDGSLDVAAMRAAAAALLGEHDFRPLLQGARHGQALFAALCCFWRCWVLPW